MSGPGFARPSFRDILVHLDSGARTSERLDVAIRPDAQGAYGMGGGALLLRAEATRSVLQAMTTPLLLSA